MHEQLSFVRTSSEDGDVLVLQRCVAGSPVLCFFGHSLQLVGFFPSCQAEDVRQLSRALGQPVDACLAACLECGGVEEAAIRLLAQTTQPKSDGHTEDAVRRLSEVSGRSLEECRAALHSHGRADDAAAYLISLTPQAPEGTRAHVSLALASSATPERPAPREPLLVPSAEPSEQVGQFLLCVSFQSCSSTRSACLAANSAMLQLGGCAGFGVFLIRGPALDFQ